MSAVLLLLGLAGDARGDVRASVENGFETSGPLEAGFLRIRLENTGTESRQVTVSFPLVHVEQQVELPPSSRKELPLIILEEGPVIVRDGHHEILRREIPSSSFVSTIVVISSRETGLRTLSQDPGPNPSNPGSPSQGSVSASGPVPGPSFSQGVRVFRTRPQDLPSSIWGYQMLAQPCMIVAHPGGYDAMTPAQREALSFAATHLVDTVLASEGRADAFTGTPLEALVPGKAVSVRSYDEWPAHFPGAAAAPSAMTVFQPDEDTVTSHTTMDGQPLVVQSTRHGHAVTYLAFDYSAPPLRSWNSRAFWLELLGAGEGVSVSAIRLLINAILDWERKRVTRAAPPLPQLGIAIAVLALGYALAVLGARKLRDNPLSGRAWVAGPAWLAAGFVAAVALGALVRTRNAGIREVSIVAASDSRNVAARFSRVSLLGPGTLRNLAAGDPHAALNQEIGEGALLHKVRLASQAPPVISEAVLERTGQIPFRSLGYFHLEGEVQASASPIVSGMNDFRFHLANRTGLKLRDVLFFINGAYAVLEDVEPGAESNTEVKLRVYRLKFASRYSTGIPSPSLSRKEALIEIATQVQTQWGMPNNSGFALARVDLPPLFPGTVESVNYLFIPVKVR